MYHNNLATLEIHTGVVNSNIELLHMNVITNLAVLKKRGHYINEDDMLECILNVYLFAQDNEFHAYITQIKAGIDDGLVEHTA